MTESRATEPVFLELGPRPHERAAYPPTSRPGSPPTRTRSSPATGHRTTYRRGPARSALLPLLHLVQAEDGHVSQAGIEFCAAQTRTPPPPR
ncbi:hypothetical protein GS934_09070 [Rhodococcus hoagii]|nr:hypothetical protein [Prescottella equi]NKZ87580.1 hypothetical protein [Prescottella equi]